MTQAACTANIATVTMKELDEALQSRHTVSKEASDLDELTYLAHARELARNDQPEIGDWFEFLQTENSELFHRLEIAEEERDAALARVRELESLLKHFQALRH